MKCDFAMIGGSGMGSVLVSLGGKTIKLPTRFGLAQGQLAVVAGMRVLAIVRHGVGHGIPPDRVLYQANAECIRSSGALACISTAAVGSLHPEWAPGTLAICSDFVDVSSRNLTMFPKQVVHCDFSSPFSGTVHTAICSAAEEARISVVPRATYVNVNGPRYETPAEIKFFSELGDVVGMTAGTEAVAMREAGIPYACIAIVTNLAAGLSKTELAHSEVIDVMNLKSDEAARLIMATIRLMSRV